MYLYTSIWLLLKYSLAFSENFYKFYFHDKDALELETMTVSLISGPIAQTWLCHSQN